MENILQNLNCNNFLKNLFLDSAKTWKLPKLGLINKQPVMASTFVPGIAFASRGHRDRGNELLASILGK